MGQFSYFLRSKQYTRLEVLDNWSSFQVIDKFNRSGTWNLEVPANDLLVRKGLITPDTGIIVQHDGKTIFSGGHTTEYEATTQTVKIAGRCDNFLLETPGRPTPALAQGPYPNDYYFNAGVASTVMRLLVSQNIGPLSPVEWKVPQLLLAPNPSLGSAIVVRSRFDPLIVLLAELASTPIATGLGFKIRQANDLTGFVYFDVYAPQDRTGEVTFSLESQTIEEFQHIYRTPAANYFIVAGGDGFGINRTVVEGGDAAAISKVGRRIAQFVDRRGVTDLSELEQELAELIAGAISLEQVTVTPTETPSLEFGTAYNLGDLVKVIVNGVSYTRIIREVEYDFSVDKGPLIKPVIADPFGSNDSILAQHVNTLEHRISNIERNWNVPENSLIPSMFHTTIRDMPGDIKLTARNAAQNGWLLCVGTSLLRSQYPALFASIGTIYGQGANPGTTFAIPDMRNRFPIGAGAAFGLGSLGGVTSVTVNLGSHGHHHSHSGGNLVYSHVHAERAHTHPGSHSHGIGSHTHNFAHGHSIDHNHAAASTGGVNYVGDAFGRDNSGATGTGHFHNYDLPSITFNSGNPFPDDITGGASGSSDQDGNVFAAQWTGALQGPTSTLWDGLTNPDGTLTPLSQSGINVQNPYLGINFEIYTGVTP